MRRIVDPDLIAAASTRAVELRAAGEKVDWIAITLGVSRAFVSKYTRHMATPRRHLSKQDHVAIVDLVERGQGRSEVARLFRISPRTVNFHCSRAGTRP